MATQNPSTSVPGNRLASVYAGVSGQLYPKVWSRDPLRWATRPREKSEMCSAWLFFRHAQRANGCRDGGGRKEANPIGSFGSVISFSPRRSRKQKGCGIGLTRHGQCGHSGTQQEHSRRMTANIRHSTAVTVSLESEREDADGCLCRDWPRFHNCRRQKVLTFATYRIEPSTQSSRHH